MYCLTCVHKFLWQSDTMREKCIILRFEIVVFSVMRPCNVNGQHRQFGLDLLHPSYDGVLTDPECSYQHSHNHVCTRPYSFLTQPHYEFSPLSAPQMPYEIILRTKMLMEKSRSENWITEQQYILWQYLISHTFPTNCEHCYILCLNSVIYCVWTLLNIVSQKLRKEPFSI